jgi:hypothetical protein
MLAADGPHLSIRLWNHIRAIDEELTADDAASRDSSLRIDRQVMVLPEPEMWQSHSLTSRHGKD